MASVIQVANRALTKLGSNRITSLSDDVKAARSISSCFEDLRDDELRTNRWQFAMFRTTLAALADAPTFGYQYQYALPPDFLRLDMINDQYPSAVMDNYIGAETQEYQIEGNVILTDIGAPLKLRYIRRIEDPNQWDVNFREMLASRIAMEICEDLTQSDTKKAGAQRDYDRAKRSAVRIGSIEKPPATPPDNSWVISRI
jgi:hypothetical protein